MEVFSMACDCNGSRFEDDFRDFEECGLRGSFRNFDGDNRNDRGDRRDRDDRRRRDCRRLANEVERRINDLKEDIRRLDNAFDRLEDRGCIRGTSRDDNNGCGCRRCGCRRCDF
jgi:hypothetical protein